MNDVLRNRVTMFNTVAEWMDKNISKITAPPKLQESLDAFKGHLAAIDKLTTRTGITSAGITESKSLARGQAKVTASHVIAILKAYAASTGNVVLQNDVDFAPSQFDRDSELVFKSRLELVIEKAGEFQAAAVNYGLTPKLVKGLKDALADFASKMTGTREVIAARKSDNQQLEGSIEDADEVLKGEMDVYMQVVQYTEPPMYDEYQAARVVVNR